MKYDATRRPPAPKLDVVIGAPDEPTLTILTRARLDTGADITLIPESIVRQLQLPVEDTIVVVGYDQGIMDRPTFLVDMRILGQTFTAVSVIAAARDEVLLGLDILNSFVTTLDGPAQELEMRMP